MKRRAVLTALAAGPLALLAACGGAKPTTIQGSVAETYYDLEELTEQSEVIATGRAISSDVDRSDGIPWTLSVIAIDTVLKGKSADTVTLRQTGTTDETAEGSAPCGRGGAGLRALSPALRARTGRADRGVHPPTVGVFEVDGDTAITPEEARDLPDFPETVEMATLEAMAADSAASDGGS